MSKIVPHKWSKLVQTNSNMINLVETCFILYLLFKLDESWTCSNLSQLISFQFILYTTTSCEISILRAFWGPLPNSICWTNSYFQKIVYLNLLQVALLITITEFTFSCLYRSMPTMDDDFCTFFLVGITSLNSILVASSIKFLNFRPYLQDVSLNIWSKLKKLSNLDSLMKFS